MPAPPRFKVGLHYTVLCDEEGGGGIPPDSGNWQIVACARLRWRRALAKVR